MKLTDNEKQIIIDALNNYANRFFHDDHTYGDIIAVIGHFIKNEEDKNE